MAAYSRCTVQNERASSQSSDKLLQILECIASHMFPVRLQDLSEQVGMTQPTVLRYLNTLLNTNYIYQEEDTLRYGLTWKICALGQHLNSHFSLRNIASTFINRLSAEMGLGSCLVIDHNFECMYLDCIDTPSELPHTLLRIGKSAPLHTTGSGKVLLASYSDAEVDEYINVNGLVKLTERTITSRDALFSELNQIRSQGYSIDEEECEVGLRCVSVPLRNYAGTTIAALSLFGSTSILTIDRVQPEILTALRETAETISLRLGYTANNDDL